MNNWLNRIRTELLEIYGESYLRFLKTEIMVYAFFPLLILLFFLSSQPYVIRTVGSWGMAGIVAIVLFIMFYVEKRYKVKLNQEMEQKFKQTAYYRWIRRGLNVVFSMLVLLIGVILPHWLNHQPQPISQAVKEYGYLVYLPTQLPFKPTKQYAIIKASPLYYEMDVFYENGDTQLVLNISKDHDEDLARANAVLKNGTKADISDYDFGTGSATLTWYQNGFRYQLSYYYHPSIFEPYPNKDVLLNIANSFKHVHP